MLNIYIWKTNFSSHKQFLFDLLLPKNSKKIHTNQSILQTFFNLSKNRNIKELSWMSHRVICF